MKEIQAKWCYQIYQTLMEGDLLVSLESIVPCDERSSMFVLIYCYLLFWDMEVDHTRYEFLQPSKGQVHPVYNNYNYIIY
jgi:hypothetical protein